MLEFRNIKKEYNHQMILDIPSLSLDKGSYWVKGANGAGKTTLLRIAAGLIDFKGDVICSGKSLKQRPVDYRNEIGWAEAEPLYPDFLTARELISFYGEIRKAGNQFSDDLISGFHIGQYLETPVGEYSSGMVKKLSLILAFIGTPSLIILDEPLTTLDAKSAIYLGEWIKKISATNTCTFLFSSHQDVETYSLEYDCRIEIANSTAQVIV